MPFLLLDLIRFFLMDLDAPMIVFILKVVRSATLQADQVLYETKCTVVPTRSLSHVVNTRISTLDLIANHIPRNLCLLAPIIPLILGAHHIQ